jgi:hypothetical protein
MDIQDFLNGDKLPKLNINKDKLLQVLLAKAIYSDAKLDALIMQVSLIKSKLNGIEESELNSELYSELTEITETINEAFAEKYAAVLAAISSLD